MTQEWDNPFDLPKTLSQYFPTAQEALDAAGPVCQCNIQGSGEADDYALGTLNRLLQAVRVAEDKYYEARINYERLQMPQVPSEIKDLTESLTSLDHAYRTQAARLLVLDVARQDYRKALEAAFCNLS